MNIKSILDNGRELIMKTGGLSTQINIISFAVVPTSYDDDITQTITGSVTISGLVFPITTKFGSREALLLEQGKVLTTDKTLFIGSANLSGNILVGIGSNKYSIIPDGVTKYEIGGNQIYNKLFIRNIVGGSLW
jgi:hypothetical protein